MKLAKVIPLAPSDDIVAELEILLEAAKRGEIVAVAYAALSARGKPISSFVGRGLARLTSLIGCVSLVKRDLMRAVDEF